MDITQGLQHQGPKSQMVLVKSHAGVLLYPTLQPTLQLEGWLEMSGVRDENQERSVPKIYVEHPRRSTSGKFLSLEFYTGINRLCMY